MSEDSKRRDQSDYVGSVARLQAQGVFGPDPSTIRYQASVARSRLAKIEEEARLLRIDLELLETLEAGCSQNAASNGETARKKKPAKAVKPVSAPAKVTVAKPPKTETTGAPLAHRPTFPPLTPKRRAERAKEVIAAAREFVKANGPEVKVKTLADFVAGKGIDMNVPKDRLSTAVGNIMFHATSEFVRIADGVYRHTPGAKGVNGHARA